MTEQLRLLVQLQEMDRKRIQQKEEAKRLPEKLKQAEQLLNQARGELDKLRTTRTRLEKNKKEKELELKITEENIVKLKEKATKLKTNEEYKAHLKEIEISKAKKVEQEDALLALMEEEELLKKEVALKEGAVAEEERKFGVQKQEMEAAIDQLVVSARSLEEAATPLSEKVEKDILEQYKKLLTLAKGLAVVPLDGNTCTGCHFNLPPQRIAEVKIGEKILTCTYCHRILYASVPPG